MPIKWCLLAVQVRMDFEQRHVRYLWPLVWPHYPIPGTQPRLHNPLGLSEGLKSSSTGPQLLRKAAAIALSWQAKNDEIAQSPSRRNWYVFYGVRYVRYGSSKSHQKNSLTQAILMHNNHTQYTITLNTTITLQRKFEAAGGWTRLRRFQLLLVAGWLLTWSLACKNCLCIFIVVCL